jgi:hypothetical protein
MTQEKRIKLYQEAFKLLEEINRLLDDAYKKHMDSVSTRRW